MKFNNNGISDKSYLANKLILFTKQYKALTAVQYHSKKISRCLLMQGSKHGGIRRDNSCKQLAIGWNSKQILTKNEVFTH